MGIFDALPEGIRSTLLDYAARYAPATQAFADWRQANMDAFQKASPREQALMLGTGFAGGGLRGVRPGPTLPAGGPADAGIEAAAGTRPAQAPPGGAGGRPVDAAASSPAAATPGGNGGVGGIPPPPEDPAFIGPPDFVDPEGRQLRAQYIVGQRRPFGPDTPLSHDELLDIAHRLAQPQLGGTVEHASPLFNAKGRRIFGDVGPVGGEAPAGGIDPHDAPLTPLNFRFDPDPIPGSPQQSQAAYRAVVPHEVGHALDFRMRNFHDVDLPPHLDPQDVEWISRHARPDHWAPGGAPRDYLHQPAELMADSFATYMTEPWWMRDRVPNPDPLANPPMGQDMAKWIRDRMNTDPRTRDLIQFNSLAPLMLPGGGGALMLRGKRER